MGTRYRTDGSGAVLARPLVVGERLKFDGDRLWWTVRAVTEHFAALTRPHSTPPGHAATRSWTGATGSGDRATGSARAGVTARTRRLSARRC